MKSAQSAMLDAQAASLERGEKTALLLARSEDLQVQSYQYVRTAKTTKKTMCIRKWKFIIAVVVGVLVLILLIWLIFIR